MTNRVFPIFAFLVALIIFFGYTNPAWTGSVAATQAKIATDAQALSAAANYTARENQLASEKNAMDSASLARLSMLLPDSVDNVGLILDLNALAARAGLSLTSADVSAPSSSNAAAGSSAAVPTTDTSPVGSVDLVLSAIGTYDSLKQFLAGVESSLRLLDVESLTVKGSTTGVYTYQITLRLYWLR